MVPNAKFPTLALAIDKVFINLARMTACGPELLIQAPRTDTEHAHTDIALRHLAGNTVAEPARRIG
jgi:hypothetical protein